MSAEQNVITYIDDSELHLAAMQYMLDLIIARFGANIKVKTILTSNLTPQNAGDCIIAHNTDPKSLDSLIHDIRNKVRKPLIVLNFKGNGDNVEMRDEQIYVINNEVKWAEVLRLIMGK